MAIAVGMFTRPIALANAVMLAITWWFHYMHAYGRRLPHAGRNRGAGRRRTRPLHPRRTAAPCKWRRRVPDPSAAQGRIPLGDLDGGVLFSVGHGEGPLSVGSVASQDVLTIFPLRHQHGDFAEAASVQVDKRLVGPVERIHSDVGPHPASASHREELLRVLARRVPRRYWARSTLMSPLSVHSGCGHIRHPGNRAASDACRPRSDCVATASSRRTSGAGAFGHGY